MSAYSLVSGVHAVYKVEGYGASVIVRSEKPIEVKRATVGPCELTLFWQAGEGGSN